jgi:hypothetical protein
MFKDTNNVTANKIEANAQGNLDVSGILIGDFSGNLTGNANTATALATAINIGGVSFDGTSDITLPGVNSAGNQSTTGNADTATRLLNARTIGGESFDGTSDINLPGVNSEGNQSTTGNADTATRLLNARNIGGVSFNGTSDINLPGVNSEGNQSTTGNADTATRLLNARNIGGVSFNGTSNINLPGVNSEGNQNTTGYAAGMTTPSGTFGTIQTNWSGTGWAGYSINGHWVFMGKDESSDRVCGIYNNAVGHWMFRVKRGERVYLYHNNSIKLQTESYGVSIRSTSDITERIDLDPNNIGVNSSKALNMSRNGYQGLEVYGSGRIYTSSSIYAGAGFSSSDNRRKHNEVDISNGLATINKLKPMFYIFSRDVKDACGNEYAHNHNFSIDEIALANDPSNGESQDIFYRNIYNERNILYESGYIAQDVSNITELNHVVTGSEYDSSGNPTALGLNYSGIQPYLTKAVQELSVLNDEKTAQIATMQTTISDLLSRISRLESRLEPEPEPEPEVQ